MTDLLRRFTSPATYLPLALALLGWFLYLVFAGALANPWEAFDLPTFRIFALLLMAMVAVGTAQTARRLREDGIFPFLSRFSALAVLLAALAVYLFRFDGTLILGEGEAYEPFPQAFSDIRKGPLARVPAPVFVLASVTPDGFTIIPGAGGRTVASDRNSVGMNGVRIALVKRGVMPLVELTAANGGVIAREYVRLDLDASTGQDSFMFVNVPYEFTVRRLKDSTDPSEILLQVAARRGKLKIAEGKVDTRTPLKVEALTVAMPEMKRSAIFRMTRQPGLMGFQAALGVFLAVNAWGALRVVRRQKVKPKE